MFQRSNSFTPAQSFVEDDIIEDAGNALPGNTTLPQSNVLETLTKFGISSMAMAALMWLLAYIFVSCLNLAAANQVFRIRGKFIEAVLKQDVGWYDTNTSTDFASRVTE